MNMGAAFLPLVTKLTLTQAPAPIVVSPLSASETRAQVNFSSYTHHSEQSMPSQRPDRLGSILFEPTWSSSAIPAISLDMAPITGSYQSHYQIDQLFPDYMELSSANTLQIDAVIAPQIMPAAYSCTHVKKFPQPTMAGIGQYLEVFFHDVAPQLPIVHPSSIAFKDIEPTGGFVNTATNFEESETQALQCAMAAVASQFMTSREAKFRGYQMHKWALHESKMLLEPSNSKVRQIILLCEYYARFRGCKISVKPSKEFEWMYRKLVEESEYILSAQPVNTFAEWVRLETNRRLLAASFLLDVHASTLHGQQSLSSSYLKSTPEHILQVPLVAQSIQLWDFQDEISWKKAISSEPSLRVSVGAAAILVPSVGSISANVAVEIARIPFDRSLLIAMESCSLRSGPILLADTNSISSSTWHLPLSDSSTNRESYSREAPSCASSVSISSSITQSTLDEHDNGGEPAIGSAVDVGEMNQLVDQSCDPRLFPSDSTALAYAALRVTPLHALLAISGDSWLFAHKVVTKQQFLAHKQRFKAWTCSRGYFMAARYAAQALLGLLNNERRSDREPLWKEISMYWIFYVCVLILWAFGHQSSSAAVEGNDIVENESILRRWLLEIRDANRQAEVSVLQRRSHSDGLVRAAKRDRKSVV